MEVCRGRDSLQSTGPLEDVGVCESRCLLEALGPCEVRVLLQGTEGRTLPRISLRYPGLGLVVGRPREWKETSPLCKGVPE